MGDTLLLENEGEGVTLETGVGGAPITLEFYSDFFNAGKNRYPGELHQRPRGRMYRSG